MSDIALQRKQGSADWMQLVAWKQVCTLRTVSPHDPIPTKVQRHLDELADEYRRARAAYEAACLECDTPVYVFQIH